MRRRLEGIVGTAAGLLTAALWASVLLTGALGVSEAASRIPEAGANVPAAYAIVPALQAARGTRRTAQVLFDDEFGGSRLDRAKWNTCYWWAVHDGCTNNPQLELEWYLPSGVSVHDGVLDLVATKDLRHRGDPYTSGMVSTDDCCGHPITFQFTYGYMEMRAKLPPGRGMWPAFWIVPADHSWPPEIDAMEWQGQKPRTNFLTIHWGTPSNPQQSGGAFVGPNLSDGFHTFGLDWEPNAVTWYQDGQPIRTYTDQTHIPNVPMIVIVNLAIGGWLGFPNAHTHFPAHMLVKYVRVWSAKS